jgi:hypothetical protein
MAPQFVLFMTYYYDDQIKYEMRRACSMHGERKICTAFWLESLKGAHHSEDMAVDVSIILKWVLG